MVRKTSFILSIPQPCKQGWENMTVSEKGRFCQSCQKEVIDFSKLSDAEIGRVLQARQGSLCGHVKKSQLGREISITEHRWSFPFRADVLAGLLALSAIQPVLGHATPQIRTAAYSEFVPGSSPDSPGMSQMLSDSTRVIRGVVYDAYTGEPLELVNICQAGTQAGVVTDREGAFTLELPDSQQAVTLEFTLVGYERYTLTLTAAEIRSGQLLHVRLREHELLLDGVMVIVPKDRSGKRGGR